MIAFLYRNSYTENLQKFPIFLRICTFRVAKVQLLACESSTFTSSKWHFHLPKVELSYLKFKICLWFCHKFKKYLLNKKR